MECPRCGCNNLPGNTNCSQCGVSLAEAPPRTVTYPPRAGKKGYREGLKRDRIRNPRRFSAIFGDSMGARLFGHAILGLISVIPGLGQIIHRHYLKAFIFASLQIAGPIVLVLNYKSSSFNLFLMFVISTYFSAVFDAALFSIPEDRRPEIAAANIIALILMDLMIFLLLAFLVYAILNYNFIFLRIIFNLNHPCLRRNEVVFASRGISDRDALQRGDLLIVSYQGRSIARVIGFPGEQVAISKGKITVDDNEQPGVFSEGLQKAFACDVRLSSNEYFVLIFEITNTGVIQYVVQVIRDSDISGRLLGVFSPPENRRMIRMES